MKRDNLCPDIQFDHFIIVVNQMAARLYDGRDVQYDPLVIRENLKEVFGTEGTWAPVSEHVRRLMESDARYPAPHFDTWTALIDIDEWCATALRWRGETAGTRPVIGRHGRDHYTKWPTASEAIGAAYCANMPCDVRILGGADRALDILGTQPKNWTTYAFGSMDARTFLSDLDFYVHFPNENYIEGGARCVIEAMASGIPVILPPVFREHFGDAALYVEPAQVWATIESLWRDKAAYLARAEAGRAYVRAHCGWEQLPRRLSRLSKARTPLQDAL